MSSGNIICCTCPEALARKWWKPVLWAGFDVRLASVEYCARLAGQSLDSETFVISWKKECWGIVMADHDILVDPHTAPYCDIDEVINAAVSQRRPFAWVSSFLDELGQYGRRGAWAIDIRGHPPLSMPLLRIFVASGCASEAVGLPGCRSIFRCDPGLIDRLTHDASLGPALDASVIWESLRLHDQAKPGSFVHEASVSRGSVNASLYTGCGMDPVTEKPTYYVGLD